MNMFHRRRSVDPRVDIQARKANLLLEKGFAHKEVSRRTGLTRGQIVYQTVKFKLKVTDYRSGKSKSAKSVLDRIDAMLGEIGRMQKKTSKSKMTRVR